MWNTAAVVLWQVELFDLRARRLTDMGIFFLHFSSCGCKGSGTGAKRRWSFWRSKGMTSWAVTSSGWPRAWQKRSRTVSPSARWCDYFTVGSCTGRPELTTLGVKLCFDLRSGFCSASGKRRDVLCFLLTIDLHSLETWEHLKSSSHTNVWCGINCSWESVIFPKKQHVYCNLM